MVEDLDSVGVRGPERRFVEYAAQDFVEVWAREFAELLARMRCWLVDLPLAEAVKQLWINFERYCFVEW